MNKRIVSLLLVLIGILAVTTAAIFVAKGYRFDRRTGTLKGTGIIAVASIPAGAAIYLNGDLYSASNNTINDLDPKAYQLKVTKEGFSSWEKQVLVEAEKVSLVNVTLFPTAPELRPITFTGVRNPQMSPDGQRLVYVVDQPTKVGLWVLDFSNRPFTFSREPKQIAKDSANFAYSKATFSWAPDSKTILVTGKLSNNKNVNYLLEADRLNDSPPDVSPTIEQTKQNWQSDFEIKDTDRLTRLPANIRNLISATTVLKWSPDELKLAISGDNKLQVFDLKKNKLYDLDPAQEFSWYPDNEHLVLVEEKLVSIVETDGQNKIGIYNGDFDQKKVFSWPDGSKLIILASFNQSAGPNLYTINLR